MLGRGRWQAWALGVILLVMAAAGGALWWIDTPSGHRFIAATVSRMKPQSGLRLSVGKIEGSIWSHMVIRDLRIGDLDGMTAHVPVAYVDWYPLAWLDNRLDIDSLVIPEARLDRVPHLKPSEKKRPILPSFDIRLARLEVGRLDLGKAVAGQPHSVGMEGTADIRSGRAVIELEAHSHDTNDAIRLSLDSRPDDNRFDINALVRAPDKGLLAGLTGLNRAFVVRIDGDGDWRRWRGRAVLAVAGRPASLVNILKLREHYHLGGAIDPSLLGKEGLAARIAQPRVMLRADGTFESRVIQGRAKLWSDAVAIDAEGGIDLGRSSFDNLLVSLGLKKPGAIIKTARSEDLQIKARLSGPFAAASYEYLVTARRLVQGSISIDDLRAAGRGKFALSNTTYLPLDVTARRVSMNNAIVDDVLRNLHIAGIVQFKDGVLTSNPIAIRSAKLDGKVVLLADLHRGTSAIGFVGDLAGLEIPGFGRVDASSRIDAVSAGAAGFTIKGQARAMVRRFDNAFLRGLAEGLPQVTTNLALGADGRILFDNLLLTAPGIKLAANGYRATDGTFHFTGSGEHKSYGALRLTLDGQIDRPKVDLLLTSPMNALGLSNVHALLTPNANGYVFTAEGGSMLGPFAGNGNILLPAGGDAKINIERLAVSDTVASGTLTPQAGGLAGTLTVAGPATGTINFAVVDQIQQIGLDLGFDRARFAGPAQLAIGRGQVKVTVLLKPGATTVDASGDVRGIRFGAVRLGRLAATANIVNGAGSVWVSTTGQGGRLYALQMRAEFSERQVQIIANGTLERTPFMLVRPAVLTREEDGWRLAPATISYRGGLLQFSGLFGGASTHIEAAASKLPLGLLDLVNGDLGLGGLASGTLTYNAPRGGVPSGSAQLRIKGLTRSGIALSSSPVDIGFNALLTGERAAMRAVVANGGTIIGRAQALLTPLHGNTLAERLNGAPLAAQIRYDGNADTLWRLTGLELFSLSGKTIINADASGTLANPLIRGTVTADNATLQSPVTGMTISALNAHGAFNGAELTLTQLSGHTQGGGTINGSGRFRFSSERGVGIELSANLDRATVLDRDDIGATVTGPISIKSEGNGGLISGDFDVIQSQFTLGKAAAVAEIPQLKVIEINRRGQELEAPQRALPWRMAIKANARNRLNVSGLGMQSEWSMDMTIGGTVTSPALTGQAKLIRGDYDFAGRRFELREGEIRFDGSTPINPTLNIVAEGDTANLTATIRVSGTSAKPQISFTSIPALPQDELLSRLLFGTSVTSLSAPEALQLASALAAFRGGGGGLDPINAIRRATGLSRLRVLPADTTTGQKASVAAGRNIGRNLYVELVTDGQGYNATRVEYQITRWLSLLSSVSTTGRQSVNVRVSKDY
jgi:translocation and assembly module TamB